MRPARTSRALVAAGLLLAGLAACGDDDATGRGLPAVDGREAPTSYRVLYEVTTPDGRGREELVVHRPFEASVTERTPDGRLVTRRVSVRGLLVTVDGDGGPTAIETAIAPPVGDVRVDRFGERLVAAGRLEAGEDGEVGGRPCRRTVETDTITTARPGTGEDPSPFPVRITRCVDAVGIVLEERIATPGGQAVRTKRAVALELGDDVDPVEVPDAAPLRPEEGGGVVDDLADHPEVVVGWRVRPPEGWVHVGTYVVQPARVGVTGGGGAAALITDVWRRGPDLLQLDQGRVAPGSTPFDPDTAIEDVELPGVGAAVLAADVRQAEVRLAGTDGGFLRVAGTLPVDELLAVAATLEPTGDGAGG